MLSLFLSNGQKLKPQVLYLVVAIPSQASSPSHMCSFQSTVSTGSKPDYVASLARAHLAVVALCLPTLICYLTRANTGSNLTKVFIRDFLPMKHKSLSGRNVCGIGAAAAGWWGLLLAGARLHE